MGDGERLLELLHVAARLCRACWALVDGDLVVQFPAAHRVLHEVDAWADPQHHVVGCRVGGELRWQIVPR